MQSSFAKDYFDLFALPVSYNVDGVLLAQRYRELQHTIHPDKYTTSSDQDRRLSLQLTAQVNEAFQTLKNPILRAKYLLQLHDAVPDDNAAMNPEFLGEQMELRERLADIKDSQDKGNELARISDDLDIRSREIQERFGRFFDSGKPDDLDSAGGIFLEMQFIDKLQREIAEIETELSI